MPYGVSYVLPIIVSCLIRLYQRELSGNLLKTILVENPEAHLHPASQSRLGIFLAQMVNNGLNIILETHSDHIINGIRIAIKRKDISNDKVLFNFFEQGDKVGQNTIRQIDIDEDGNLSDWPKGFFDQYENDLMDLM